MSENQGSQGLQKNANKPASAPADKVNPSVTPAVRVTEETRIPMSVRDQKLAVPEIPGYHLHFAIDRRVSRMLRAGYEFVTQEEAELANFDIAGDRGASGSTDLGSRVSVAAGESDDSGRLVLMKIRNEWWDADCQKMEQANEAIAAKIRGGDLGDGSEDHRKHKYLKEGQELFIPRQKRRHRGF